MKTALPVSFREIIYQTSQLLPANPKVLFFAIEPNELTTTAARFVNQTNAHIFLTGKAGTGKTTFLRDLSQKTHKRFVIVAPTGIAALNAKGVTIHSQFLLPLGTFLPVRDPSGSISESANVYTQNTLARKHPLNAARRQVLRDIDLLIIDEVSMLRADVLDAIDYRLRSVKRNYNRSFGGVQVLMIGDLFQLPPIVRDHEWSLMRQHYSSAWFFEAHALKKEGYVFIELEKIYRQQDDAFIRILNNLRNNTPSAEDIELLNQHYRTSSEQKDLRGVVTLTTHNHRADDLNRKALDQLEAETHYYEAEVENDFPESMYPVDVSIELKVGAQVMFIKNDAAEGRYFNGKLARIHRLTENEVQVVMEDESKPYTLKKEEWQNRKYRVDEESKELEEEVIGSFRQYPIKLAWAITVHKSQGLTFERAIIDVGRAFAPGQVYVALSRLRSLDGLILSTRIDPGTITSDAEVVQFSQRKDQQAPLPEMLNKGQRIYIEQLLLSTFNFSDISDQVGFLNKDKGSSMEFEDPGMRNALSLLREELEKEASNTEIFRKQLLRLLHNGEQQELLTRLQKGSAYYQEKLKNWMRQLLTHLAEVQQFTRTKTYANGLEEIDLLIVKSLTDVMKVVQAVQAIQSGQDIPRDAEGIGKLKAIRQTMLSVIQQQVETDPRLTKSKSGRKKKKKKAPGEKEAKGATYLKTLALANEGKSIDEIAEARGMASSTIESHIARLITDGQLEPDPFLEKEARQTISKAFAEEKNQTTSDVYKALNAEYTYGQIRIVQAVLARLKK